MRASDTSDSALRTPARGYVRGLLRLAHWGLRGAPLGGNFVSIQRGHNVIFEHLVAFVWGQSGQPACNLGGHIDLGGLQPPGA